ncbi:hypothetical protein D7Y23_30305 [Corallococcus sp. AB050B]|nr:hypothetical protein D7Y23_30305 [Corallococcus sp. AB050B]
MAVSMLSRLNSELNDAPALNVEVLTEAELEAVTGGYIAEDVTLEDGACTCGTRSVCHIDGTTDSD